MAPNSTAERCKKYYQKRKEVYRVKNALQKRKHREKMKANQIANKERLRFQREKKQKYRQRVKESIATATAANLVKKHNDDSAFSQAHLRSRSILKVAKTLSKSPKKCKEVISALANKFKLSIKPTQSKAGRSKNEFKKHMSPQVKKISIMLGKLMVKASMSRSDILCGHSMIY